MWSSLRYIAALLAVGAALLVLPSSPPQIVRATTTFTVNSTANDADAVPGDGVCETVPLPGTCTLRAAIQEANVTPGTDTIAFSIASGWQTITIQSSPLPPLVDTTIIDGTTQPGYSGSPLIELRPS